MLRGNIFPYPNFFCIFVCLFCEVFYLFVYVTEVLLLQFLASLLSLLFLLTYGSNQMEEFGMKTACAKPNPFPSLSKVDLSTKRVWIPSCYYQTVSLAMKILFSWWKFLTAGNSTNFWGFNIRKLVCLYSIIIRSGQWVILIRKWIFLFPICLSLWSLFIYFWTCLELRLEYWVFVPDSWNPTHLLNLLMFVLWQELKCITHHH